MSGEIDFENLKRTLKIVKSDYIFTDKDLHDSLIAWFSENYLDLDSDIIKEGIVKDTKTEGIDAVFLDEDNNTYHIISAKSKNDFKKTKNNFSESEVLKTIAGFEFLLKSDYKGKITPELENLIDEFHDKINTGGYTTYLTFIAMLGDPFDKKYIEDFNNRYKKNKIACVFYNYDFLVDFYKNIFLKRKARPPINISLQIIKQCVFEKKDPYESIVFTTRGEDIARIFNDHGIKIYQQNVRYSLGMSSRSINKQIFETSKDEGESKKFWYFNNGITFVCEDFIPSGNNKVINLKRAQIINGTQTTDALYNSLIKGELKHNVELLIKVIKTSDQGFIEKVTLFTNSQNAIDPRDLCSNDDIQNISQNLIKGYTYFYEIKRGEFDSKYPTLEAKRKKLGHNYKARIISNINAAQAYMAMYLDKAAEAKANKGKIFIKDSTGFYNEIFDENDRILFKKILLSWILLKFIEEKAKEFKKESEKTLQMNEKGDLIINLEYLRYNYILHGEYFILNIFRDFLKHRNLDIYNNKDLDELINIIENENNNIINEVYEEIKENMADYIDKIQEEDSEYYHNKFFKLSRNLKTIRDFFNKDFSFVKKL